MIYLDGKVVEIKTYPDGTIRPVLENIDSRLPYITWLYDNDAELFAVYCLAKHYKSKTLEIPYLPNARMDRVKSDTDVFTLKHICDILNMTGATITTLDVHSRMASELLLDHHAERLGLLINLLEAISKDPNSVVVFPDAGANERYCEYLDKYPNFAYTYANKVRDWDTGKITSLDIVDKDVVKGKTVLIVDDICSYGTTFVLAANACVEAGAKDVKLYVTHCEDSINKGLVRESPISAVYTTNSLYRKPSDGFIHVFKCWDDNGIGNSAELFSEITDTSHYNLITEENV